MRHWLIVPLLLFSIAATASAPAAEPAFPLSSAVLEAAVTDRAFPGCAVAVGNHEGPLWTAGLGRLDYDGGPKATPKTLYDLASLTKVVGTTMVVMQLVDRKKLALDDPVGRHLPEFVEAGKDDAAKAQRQAVTLKHLLTHSSGLPAWKRMYDRSDGYQAIIEQVVATPLDDPPGEKYRYSDLGFMLLGEVAARAGGKPLAELERSLVFDPLGMKSTFRNPRQRMEADEVARRIAPTERMAGKETHWQGIVHDENARAGGGLTGHAGLFSTVEDLGRLGTELLRAWQGKSRHLPGELVREFSRRAKLPPGSHRALGWETATGRNSAGSLLSAEAFGHTGFTGTTIWIDPQRDLWVVLLTNRVHPTRAGGKIAAVRRRLHDAAVKDLSAGK